HPDLVDYAPAAWAAAIQQLMDRQSPTAIIASGTDRGNEVMAYVGARTGLPMAANCLTAEPATAGQPIVLTRQRWAGSLVEEARLSASTALLTVAPHAV